MPESLADTARLPVREDTATIVTPAQPRGKHLLPDCDFFGLALLLGPDWWAKPVTRQALPEPLTCEFPKKSVFETQRSRAYMIYLFVYQ